MAFTPTDATKAEVRITGTSPNQQLDFYIPPGANGATGTTGPAGPPNTLQIGTVTTGATGSNAVASFTGVAPNQALNLTIPTGATGATGSPTAYELRGTGMPEGVVTAAVGTYYTDSAGTNGAWRWLKKTGAGNTGWAVSHGDTGVRDIAALFSTAGYLTAQNGAVDKLTLRRVGVQVELLLPGYNMTVTNGPNTLAWPAGFKPMVGPHFFTTFSPSGIPTGSVNAHDTGLYVKAASTAANDRAIATWYTADAWPTTLPGIPG